MRQSGMVGSIISVGCGGSMKCRLATLSILCFAMHGVALADAYNNGPILGTAHAFLVDQFAVTDSFQPNAGRMTSFRFGAWSAAGTTPAIVSWTVGVVPFGDELGSGIASLGWNLSSVLICSAGVPLNGGVCGAGLGDDVYEVTISLGQSVTTIPGRTYWLTLTRAEDQFH